MFKCDNKKFIEVYTFVLIYHDLDVDCITNITRTYIDDLDAFNKCVSDISDCFCSKHQKIISINTYHNTVRL